MYSRLLTFALFAIYLTFTLTNCSVNSVGMGSKDGNHVFLAESAWTLKMAQDNFPDVVFHFTSEF